MTTPGEQAATIAELVRRIDKLSRINAALMQRVERSMDQQANAYSLFQTAIGLESQVRIRTEELNAALARLATTNAALGEARDHAERANRFKTRFFTAVGHDLLQPLHAARLSLSALGETAAPHEQRRIVDQIDHALSSVDDLLRSILDISKLEAGVITPAPKPIAVGDLFGSLVNDLAPLANSKQLVLTARTNDLMVSSDPLMLRRILQNLAVNAIRYTGHGEVKLAARLRGSHVRLEVWDTGPGIAAAERDRIYEEFQRGAAAERTGRGGFGLGLAIVKRNAEILGHEVALCSLPGKGSRFSILAPYAGRATAGPGTEATTPGFTYGFGGAEIVVLDNDEVVLEAMQSLLVRWNCRVRIIASLAGVDALLAEPEFEPRLVLADFHLDNGELGIAAIERLRQAKGETLPAVVITADHSHAVADQVRSAGADLLLKPVKPAELRALLQHILSS